MASTRAQPHHRKSATSPPSLQTQQSTTIFNLMQVGKGPLLCHQLVGNFSNVSQSLRALTFAPENAQQKGETVQGGRNNQAVCHKRAWAHNQERSPTINLVVVAMSNPPIPSLQPSAGGTQINRSKKESKQQSNSKFSSKMDCLGLKMGMKIEL